MGWAAAWAVAVCCTCRWGGPAHAHHQHALYKIKTHVQLVPEHGQWRWDPDAQPGREARKEPVAHVHGRQFAVLPPALDAQDHAGQEGADGDDDDDGQVEPGCKKAD